MKNKYKDTPIGSRVIFNDGEIGTVVHLTGSCVVTEMENPDTGIPSTLQFTSDKPIYNWRSNRFDGSSSSYDWGIAHIGEYEECPW